MTMHLIEILLPVTAGEKSHKIGAVRKRLTEKFGGVTAFTRAPAEGLNKDQGRIVHDDIVVIEAMTEKLDRKWWSAYRETLEKEFAQDEIVIRASTIERL